MCVRGLHWGYEDRRHNSRALAGGHTCVSGYFSVPISAHACETSALGLQATML